MKNSFLLLVLLLVIKLSFGQWQAVDILSQSDADYVFKTNQSIFLISENAKCLYKSNDNGINWEKNFIFSTFNIYVNPCVRKVIVMGDTIIICTAFSVYRSFNNGNSWSETQIQNSPQSFFYLNNTLYRYDNGELGSVFKSNDFGVSWVQDISSSLSGLFVLYSKELNDTIYALSTFYSTGIYKIINDNEIELICQFTESVNFFDANDYLMGVLSSNDSSNSVLHISNNRGLSWSTYEFYDQASSFVLKGDTVIVLFNDSVIYSINEGLTWSKISNLHKYSFFNNYFFINGNEYLNSVHGFLRRQNNQFDWEVTNFQYPAKHPFFIIIKDNQIFFDVTANYYRKTIGQQDLNALTIYEDNNILVYDLKLFGNTLFQFSPIVGLSRSLDNGDTWIQIDLGVPNLTLCGYSRMNMTESNDTLYLTINHYQEAYYILMSTDEGVSWSTIYTESDINTWITYSDYSAFFKRDSFLFIGYSDFSNYHYRRYNIVNGVITGFTIIYPPSPFVSCIGDIIITSDNKSYDFGDTWIPCGNGLTQGYYPYRYEFSGNDSVMFCFVPDEYDIFASLNHGDSWFSIKENIQSKYIFCANVYNDTLYVGTMLDSLYVRSISDIDPICVSGNVFFDNDNNQQFDVLSDVPASEIKVYSAISSNNYTTSSNGNYYIFLSETSNVDTLRVLNSFIYSTIYPEFYVVNQSDTSKNFAISRIPGINDLRVDITSYSIPRPGFDYILDITCKNEGTTTLDANLSLSIDDLFTYQNSSETPLNILGNLINWSISNFQPLQSKSITVNLKLINSDILGEQISIIASLSPILGDTTMENNTDSIAEIVVGSFDPNDKTVNRPLYLNPQEVLSKSEMIYTIRFQNTGTWYAENVSILDTLHRNLDWSTFRVIAASHDYNFDFSGNGVVQFHFPNINLPDSNMNEAASHGFIKYSIRLNNSIQPNDSIANTAYIYFDYNEAIVTNTALNIVKIDAAINENTNEFNLSVYPNPAKTSLNIRFEESSSYNLTLFSIDGRIVLKEKSNSEHHVLNIASLENGIYLLKVSDANRSKVVKIIVE